MAVPDVAFDALEPARLVARLSRFHAAVRTRPGVETLAHVPNSGRLVEVLRPGAPLAISPRPGLRRKTSHDLVLVGVPDDELGPRAGQHPSGAALAEWWGDDGPLVWASVDARLPPRIVAAAAARGAIPGLEGATVLATEPELGVGRADLLLEVPGRPQAILVEAKSTTLADGGVGLFPDSPTARGATQVAALARARGPAAVVFVCQRSDAHALAPNWRVDGRFAATLADAVATGVAVHAGTCSVDLDGIRWARCIPVEGIAGGVDHRRRAGGGGVGLR